MRTLPLLLLIGLVLLSGADTPNTDPNDRIRAGNAHFTAGQLGTAATLYEQAADRTADPGLVAFNTAAVLFEQGDYRGAELAYLQALSDAEIPPERRMAALFNRGVCLLKRGDDTTMNRVAIDCFTAVATAPHASAELRADARYNLELAKLRWNQARMQKPDPPRANDPSPEQSEPRPPQPEGAKKPPEPAPGSPNPAGTATPTRKPAEPGAKPLETRHQMPGTGTLPVLNDRSTVTPLSPADTRALLDRIAERLRKDRQSNARLVAGPERPHVRDW